MCVLSIRMAIGKVSLVRRAVFFPIKLRDVGYLARHIEIQVAELYYSVKFLFIFIHHTLYN